MNALICFFLLLTTFYCQADTTHQPDQSISWQGKAPGGVSASMAVFPNQINIDQSLTVQLTLTFPATHRPQWKVLVPHLLSYEGFGAPPFTLITQNLEPQTPKASLDNTLSQQLTLILSPQMPGTHNLTFYEIPFIPNSTKEGETIAIVSGIVPIEVTVSPTKFNPALIVAPPMSLSSDLPIAISTSNRRAYITNVHLASEAVAYNFNALHNKAIPWQIFPTLITLLVLIMIIKFHPKESKK